MAININGTGSITGLSSISAPGISGVPVGSASAPAFSFTGDTNTGIYSPGADQVAISTNSSERIRIGANGEIGLGGANYGTNGQVLTSAGSGAAPTWQTPAAGNADKIEEGNSSAEVIDTGSDGRFVVTTEGTERLRVTSSGQLLVGTSTNLGSAEGYEPRLQVAGSTQGLSIGRYQANNPYGAQLYLQRSKSDTVGGHAVMASGDEVGYISFEGSDGTAFKRAAAITALVDGTPGTNDMPGRLVFSTTADGASSPTERMRIANDGKMGFGTTTLTGKFNFDGSLYLFTQPSGAGNSTLKWNSSTGAVTYDTSSRLVKENIEDCPYGLVELSQLKPRKYFRTDDQKVEIGFVADEVADVLPEFVPIGPKHIITKNEADTEEIPLGVNYEKLTAVLTKALQETIGEIESLKARVAALESA